MMTFNEITSKQNNLLNSIVHECKPFKKQGKSTSSVKKRHVHT
ncbi:hypothetical protein BLGI_3269 [Brevibacillus laterosporus GI-9]|nr:hypothetical protein BLGI_3269 [Brevibacillus laterosporus GI-9]